MNKDQTEYLCRHAITHGHIKNLNIDDEKFNEACYFFDSLDKESKMEISKQITKEIIILFKIRGIRPSLCNEILDNFQADLILYKIFGDNVSKQKDDIDFPVSKGFK